MALDRRMPTILLDGVPHSPAAAMHRAYAREQAQAPTSLPPGYGNPYAPPGAYSLGPPGSVAGPGAPPRNRTYDDGLPPPILEGEVLAAEGPAYDPEIYDDDLLAKLIEYFEDAEQATRDNRLKAERDVDYFDNKQFTSEIITELEKRGQPAIMLNRIRRKIKFLMGFEQAQRTKPQGLPVNPADEDDAHAATDALRSVCATNNYDQKRSKVWKDLISAGWGGLEVVAEPQPNRANPKITVRATRWDRMFHDPYSSEDDYSDANYLGIVIWMDREDGIRRYGPAAAEVFDVTIGESGNTYDDKPKETSWVSRQARPRIRVVQMYFCHPDDGVWHFCEFSKGGYLRAGVSPWLDENGEPEHPYAWRSANVDRDNNRYGVIREMVDIQDALNKLVSKYLHLASVRQTFGTEGSLGRMSTREMRTQLARPDGHVPLAPGKTFGQDFGVIPTGDMQNANMILLKGMMQEMDLIGANAAMEGESGAAASGKSVVAQQQGGAIEVAPEMDTLRDMDRQAYHKMWRRVRQFWEAEEWVRVTDDLRNTKFIGLNVMARQPVIDPASGQPMVDPATGQIVAQPVMDPLTGKPVIAKGDVSRLDLDILIDEAPMVTGSMMDEQFKGLVALANVGIRFAPGVYIAASTLRNKPELLRMQQEALQKPPDPVQQAAVVAQIEDKRASAAQKQAGAQKAQAQAVHSIAQARHLSVITGGAAQQQLDVAKKQSDIETSQAKAAADIELRKAQTAHEHIKAVGSAASIRNDRHAAITDRLTALAGAADAAAAAGEANGGDGRPQPGGPPVQAPDGEWYVHAPHPGGLYQRVVGPR